MLENIDIPLLGEFNNKIKKFIKIPISDITKDLKRTSYFLKNEKAFFSDPCEGFIKQMGNYNCHLIENIEIAESGHINFYLKEIWYLDIICKIYNTGALPPNPADQKEEDSSFKIKSPVYSESRTLFHAQYTHSRICNILKYSYSAIPYNRGNGSQKISQNELYEDFINPSDISGLVSPEEQLLISKITGFLCEIHLRENPLNKKILERYLVETDLLFHNFFNSLPLNSEGAYLRECRLILTKCTSIILKYILNHLGLHAPDHL